MKTAAFLEHKMYFIEFQANSKFYDFCIFVGVDENFACACQDSEIQKILQKTAQFNGRFTLS